MTTDSCRQRLLAHLDSWGLKRFTSDAEYFAWQRQVLSVDQTNRLHALVELKRRGTADDEAAFYDATADPQILPVLYSQRYDYYCAVGPRVAARIGDARTVLDFGCGVGILTTFYAARFPDITFVGIDRSPQSVAAASERALARGLRNVRFERHDMEQRPFSGSYDVIVATHALVQSEQDPGLPSRDWTTFERDVDRAQQRAFETRTGVGARLDHLCAGVAAGGRMLVCEKTRQLARRVPFQRALASRGLALLAAPESIRYQLVEEAVDDGPFYVLAHGPEQGLCWDECPEPDEEAPFDPGRLPEAGSDHAVPLYENHRPSAQRVWERLAGKQVLEETTRRESDGRQLHVEIGRAGPLAYLYCANTFDQRQLVIVESGRQALVQTYYREIMRDLER
jgi:SAM-dependent methyltransferase